MPAHREESGDPPYEDAGAAVKVPAVPTFLVSHRHPASECGWAFAAWHGFASPLRHGHALSSCPDGGHALFWVLEAEDETGALSQLPEYLSARSEVIRVRPVPIP